MSSSVAATLALRMSRPISRVRRRDARDAARCRIYLLDQLPPVGVDVEARVAGVLVVDGVHLVDRIEESDDERGAERFARL